MLNQRASGILLHPTSLPGKYGAGDFGSAAYQFIDWLVEAGQTYWQILPLGKIGPGNSPYMSSSAFAGNILLIDLEDLVKLGFLTQQDLLPEPGFSAERVDFGLLHVYHMQRLHRAAQAFFSGTKMQGAYRKFCTTEQDWLEDYALFMAIAEHENWRDWNCWPKELAQRSSVALRKVKKQLAEKVNFWKFCQWCFARQWFLLKSYANRHGVEIIGDMPIFVAYQSADVWAHQELFKLDKKGSPTVVAGVPPDYFSETGQLWGNPLYRWNIHQQTGFSWWIARLRHALKLADVVRIDHFRGFVAYWEVEAKALNAINGKWKKCPGDPLFKAFKKAFPELPIIAEDLGLITPDVIALRDKFKLPGMCILQFAFGDGEGNFYLPHHYQPNIVAYTGTHDNDTTVGWWHTLSERDKTFAQQYLSSDGHSIHWDMMRALSKSAANTVIFPMQDVLGLSGEHRMNYPGKPEGNWEWRFSWEQLKPEFTRALAAMSVEYKRTPGRSDTELDV